jgi:hypothetical protein
MTSVSILSVPSCKKRLAATSSCEFPVSSSCLLGGFTLLCVNFLFLAPEFSRAKTPRRKVPNRHNVAGGLQTLAQAMNFAPGAKLAAGFLRLSRRRLPVSLSALYQ